mmetsp:Transcript_1460/g.3128  ORF Transcript_1460/g.3128 Transcript_1460/m.3128 type:complete len:223 (+) Transcript_1460:487-1155(+)
MRKRLRRSPLMWAATRSLSQPGTGLARGQPWKRRRAAMAGPRSSWLRGSSSPARRRAQSVPLSSRRKGVASGLKSLSACQKPSRSASSAGRRHPTSTCRTFRCTYSALFSSVTRLHPPPSPPAAPAAPAAAVSFSPLSPERLEAPGEAAPNGRLSGGTSSISSPRAATPLCERSHSRPEPICGSNFLRSVRPPASRRSEGSDPYARNLYRLGANLLPTRRPS